MINRIINASIVISMLIAHDVLAGLPSYAAAIKQGQSTHQSYKTEAGNCNIPTSQIDLDINNVRARLQDAGDAWWDPATSVAHYEVPKGPKGSDVAYPQAIFAGSIWVSALDAGNNLKIAALTYRQSTTDFYTGPLAPDGSVDVATCNRWDQHFSVLGTNIKSIIDQKSKKPADLVSGIDESVLRWPGKGNKYLKASDGYDMSGVLAPFYDYDGDGLYDPTQGDYPAIKNCPCINCGTGQKPPSAPYADQMVFWVMNDKGNTHSGTQGGSPLSIQINTVAFAFSSSDEVNNMTFYTYSIVNKSPNNYSQTYMSQFLDVDLGCASNDRVGCDTSRSLGICYNGTTPDPDNCSGGNKGYGSNLPMLGVDFFEGPTATDSVGVGPDRQPRKLGLSSFSYFTNGTGPLSDPSTGPQFRNYQEGKWKDGQPIVYGGNGRVGSGQPTKFMFSGDPSNATQWSECNPQFGAAIPADDRRMLLTSGPFSFISGSSQAITIGVVFVQPPGGVGSICPSFSANIGLADDKAQALFDNCFVPLTGPSAPLLQVRELKNQVILNLESDPAGNNVNENFAALDVLRLSKGYKSGQDSLYRFQGNLVYQLSGPEVGITELGDPTKAKLITEMDIADNVNYLVNWELFNDLTTGTKSWRPTQSVPLLSPTGGILKLANTGISHSLSITNDLFKNTKLVNNKTYYFGVVAFASNNFMQFNPDSSKGQKEPFLIGKNFNVYAATPGDPTVENEGRVLNSVWGQATNVKRIEGQGNGGNYLNLTPATITGILGSTYSYQDVLGYGLGITDGLGNTAPTFNDPIAFKVVDPINLKEADFELAVYDSILYNGFSVSPNAYWLLRDITNGKTIHSERAIDRSYEQVIKSDDGTPYGFSVTLGTPFSIYTNLINSRPIYPPIGGSITFKDPTKPWLSFIKDEGEAVVTNWIRSGTAAAPCPSPIVGGSALCNVWTSASYPIVGSNAQVFFDPKNVFSSIADGKWAPYCLTANYSTAPGENTQFTNPTATRPASVGGPGFKWDRYDSKAASPRNNLDKLQSVDIVITADKSKWSRCVVLETSENAPVGDNVATSSSGKGPRKGMLRDHYSLINKDASTVTYDSDPNSQADPGGGRSWFPGYAVNVETGERLNIAFGEASDQGSQNGRDMVWNPTSKLLGDLTLPAPAPIPNTPIFAGKHFIYVFDTKYDEGLRFQNVIQSFKNGDITATYDTLVNRPVVLPVDTNVRSLYDHIMWTAMPYLTSGYKLASFGDGLIPDGNDVTIKLRVQKPYSKYARLDANGNSIGDSLPKYTFSTKGLGKKENVDSVAKTALDKIRIVPNPYLAYSTFENNANDGRIKITNLPNVCTIKIYSLEGTLIKVIERSVTVDPIDGKKIEISDGLADPVNTVRINYDNTAEWDLKNQSNITVASGIYLFDITAPGIGHKILKWFGAVRPTDISNF